MSAKGDPISGITYGASSSYKGPIPEELEVKTLRVTSGLDVGNLNVTGTFSYNNINASAEVQTDTLTEFTAGADISVLNSLVFTRPDAPIALTVFDLAGGTTYGLAKIGGAPSYQSKYVPFSSSVASGYTFTGSNGSGIETMLARLEYDNIVSRSVLAISKIVGFGSNGTYLDAPIIGSNAPTLPGSMKYDPLGNVLQYCDNTGLFQTLSVGTGVIAGPGINVTGITVSLADTIAPTTISTTNITATNSTLRNINNVTSQNIKFTTSGANNVNINDKIICDQTTTQITDGLKVDDLTISTTNTNEMTLNSDNNKLFLAVNNGGTVNTLSSGTTGIGINNLSSINGTDTININSSIQMGSGKTINGVDFTAFYNSYSSRVDQAVNTTSNVSFGNVTSSGTISGATMSISGSSTALNTYTSGLYANTLKANMAVDTGVTIAGVNLANFYSDYTSKVNQSVLTSSTPTFAGVSSGGTISATTLSGTTVMGNTLSSITGDIALANNIVPNTGVTFAGVNVANFYADYGNKVDQSVKVSSAPVFNGLQVFNTTRVNTIKVNFLGANEFNIYVEANIEMDVGKTINGVNITNFYNDYTSKIDQSVKSTSAPTFAGLTLSGPLTTSSTIAGIDLGNTINGSNPLLSTSSPTFAGLTVTGNATEQILARTSTGTGKAKLVLGTPTIGSAPNKAAMIAVGSGTNSTSTLYLCLNNSTNNTSAAEVTESDAKITITSAGLVGINYAGTTPADNLGIMASADFSRLSMTHNYGTGTRAYFTRLNSGTGSGGRNRVEFYGIDSAYNSGSSGYDAFNSTFGFTFQQKPTAAGSYQDILDISSNGINIGSSAYSIPLNVTGRINQNVGTNMTFTSPGTATDFYFGRGNGTTGLQMIAGPSNTHYFRPTANTDAIEIQSWSGSTASTVARVASDMLSVNRLVLNNNIAGIVGGIGRNGTALQFNDGVAARDVCMKSLDLSNSVSYLYGPTYTILGSTTLASTAVHTYVIGGSFTGNLGTDILSFTGRWTFIGVTFTCNITLTAAQVNLAEFIGCTFIFNNNQKYSLGSVGDVIITNCYIYGTNYSMASGTVAPIILNAPHIKFMNNKIAWNQFVHSAITDTMSVVSFNITSTYGTITICGNSIRIGPTGPASVAVFLALYVGLMGTSAGTTVHYTNNHFDMLTDYMQASKTFICLYVTGGILDVSNNTFACNNASSPSPIFPVMFANRNKLFGRTNTKIGAMNSSYIDDAFTSINFDSEGNSLLF